MHAACKRTHVGKKRRAFNVFEAVEPVAAEFRVTPTPDEESELPPPTKRMQVQMRQQASKTQCVIPLPGADGFVRTPAPPVNPAAAVSARRFATPSKKVKSLLSPLASAQRQGEARPPRKTDANITGDLMRLLNAELAVYPDVEQLSSLKGSKAVAAALPACEQRLRLFQTCFDTVVPDTSTLYQFLTLWHAEYQGHCAMLRGIVADLSDTMEELEDELQDLRDNAASPPIVDPGAAALEPPPASPEACGASQTEAASHEERDEWEAMQGWPRYSFEENAVAPPPPPLQTVQEPQDLKHAIDELREVRANTVSRQHYMQAQRMIEQLSKKINSLTFEYNGKLSTSQDEVDRLLKELHETKGQLLDVEQASDETKRQQVAAMKLFITSKMALQRRRKATVAVQTDLMPSRDHGTMTDLSFGTFFTDATQLRRKGSTLVLTDSPTSRTATPVLARRQSLDALGRHGIKGPVRKAATVATAELGVQCCIQGQHTHRRRSTRRSSALMDSLAEMAEVGSLFSEGALDIKPAGEYKLVDLSASDMREDALTDALAGVKNLEGKLWDRRDIAVLKHDGSVVATRAALEGVPRHVAAVSSLATTVLCREVTWAVSTNGSAWTKVPFEPLEALHKASSDDTLLIPDAVAEVLGCELGSIFALKHRAAWGLEHYEVHDVSLVRYANPMTGTLYHDTWLWSIQGMEEQHWIPSDILEYVHSLPSSEVVAKRGKWELFPVSDPELKSVQLRCSQWRGSELEKRDLTRLAAKVLSQPRDLAFGAGIVVPRRQICEMIELATQHRSCTPALLARALQLQALVYRKAVFVLLLTASGDEGFFLLDTSTKKIHPMRRTGSEHQHQPLAVLNDALGSPVQPYLTITHPGCPGRYVCTNAKATDVHALLFKYNDYVARWTGASFCVSRAGSGTEVTEIAPKYVHAAMGAWLLPSMVPVLSAMHGLVDNLLAASGTVTRELHRIISPHAVPQVNPFQPGTAIRWQAFSLATDASSLDHTPVGLISVQSQSAVSLAKCSRFSRVATYMMPPVPLVVKESAALPLIKVRLEEISEKEVCSSMLRGLIGAVGPGEAGTEHSETAALLKVWQSCEDPTVALQTLAKFQTKVPQAVLIAKQLVRAGASRSVLDEQLLASVGHAQHAALLLEAGADPLTRDRTQYVCILHIACSRGFVDTARHLVSHHGIPDSAAERGAVFMCALKTVGKEGLDIVKQLCSAETLQYKDSRGRTPMHAAIESGIVPLMSFLMSEGASCTTIDSEGCTPTDLAIESLDLPTVMFMEDYIGTQITKESFPPGALHKAAQMNKTEAIGPLIHYGFDPNDKDAQGRTAYDVAAKLNNSGAMKLLRAVTT